MNTIIASTNRQDSNTLRVANYYSQQLTLKNIDNQVFSLTDLPSSIADSGPHSKHKEDFLPVQHLITQTRKFIFVIPEYNGSFPGILKLFIDSCRYPESFRDKKTALVGLSNGKYGNIRGIDHFTGICHYLGMDVMPLKIHIPHISAELNEDHQFFKEDTLKFTDQQIERFIHF